MAGTRYSFQELLTTPALGQFNTGDTVTIILYNALTGAVIPLDSNSCTEIGTEGSFSFSFGEITTPPTSYIVYMWVMTNGLTKQKDYLDVGGWVEGIGATLAPAGTCRITVNLYDADGVCKVSPNDLFKSALNYIELKDSFFSTSRYYKLDKYLPSYDEITGQAFWTMPRLAVVEIKLASFGISVTSKTVPDEATIDLNAWILLP